MKYIIALLPVICGLWSCNTSGQQSRMVYTGDFAGEPIEITLIQIDDSVVKGTSKHKGIESDMKGVRVPSERGYHYRMKELGTSDYEGEFDFELDTATRLIYGSWQLADKTRKMGVVYTLSPKSGE